MVLDSGGSLIEESIANEVLREELEKLTKVMADLTVFV